MEQIATAMALIGLAHKIGLLVERIWMIKERVARREAVSVEELQDVLADVRGEAQALVGTEGVGEGAAQALEILNEVDVQMTQHGPDLQEALDWALAKVHQARELYAEEADRLYGERREEMARRMGKSLLPGYRARLTQVAGAVLLVIGLAGCVQRTGVGTYGREKIVPLPNEPGSYGLIYEFPAVNGDGLPIDALPYVKMELVEDSSGGQRVMVGTIWTAPPEAPDFETEVR